MVLLSHDLFQPPLPSLVFLIPPSSLIQWLLRSILLMWTIIITFPCLLVLVPLSVLLHRTSWNRYAPLPLHPHHLPPHLSLGGSSIRGLGVYGISAIVWSVTSLGNPPILSHGLARSSARIVIAVISWLSNLLGTTPYPNGKLHLEEVDIPIFEDRYRVGALRDDPTGDILIEPIVGFWLSHVIKDVKRGPTSSGENARSIDTRQGGRKVYLFFTGGGYVVGPPLTHPFIINLAQTFPPSSQSTVPPSLPHRAILAPTIHKSLSRSQSFPVPVLDGLAAYAWLRSLGYTAGEIVIMGDSAGAGLSWSVVSYLCVLRDMGIGDLGVPGGLVMISPWLTLPPTPAQIYPDYLDEPQLLQAARCYLARYPILKHRPNPFESDWYLYKQHISRVVKITARKLADITLRLSGLAPMYGKRSAAHDQYNQEARDLLNPKDLDEMPNTLEGWLDPSVFARMTSHHPFISPATDPASPFIHGILEVMRKEDTRVMIHIGTAEWLYKPTMRFAKIIQAARVDVEILEDIGGMHSEAALVPVEFSGSARRLLDQVLLWSA